MTSHHDDWHEDRIKDECGVVALYTPGHAAAPNAFYALFALQHRGQESAGIASLEEGGHIDLRKGMGLVSQVFTKDALDGLEGHMAIGHTRYSTTGSSVEANAQPIMCLTKAGEIAVAHNGNLVNAAELREELAQEGFTFEGTADSEVMAKLIVKHMKTLRPEDAVAAAMRQMKGAYSVVVLTPKALMGFRDPNGIRPLSVGRIFDDMNSWMIASESCAFAPFGENVQYDLQPGECVIIDERGFRIAQCVPPDRPAMCLFEFIYFARPDSRMYDRTLYMVREEMGRQLAIEKPCPPGVELVIPVPDSGIPAALGYADKSGIPFAEGMMKSRYIHRTFIDPDQRMRERGVRQKLSPLTERIRGRRIVLVDDSIVRGTTTGKIVQMLRDAGAIEVHVRITAPPIKHPCFYGIDMAESKDLIAHNMTEEEICRWIRADSLGYLSLAGAVSAAGKDESHFCTACFSGNYPIIHDVSLKKDVFESRLEPLVVR